MCLKRATVDRRLTGKLSLNFGANIKSDGHTRLLCISLRPTVPEAASGIKILRSARPATTHTLC
jgi:hypothetical protein